VGTEADPAKALYWYEKAAEQGDADAQLRSGWAYDSGEGAKIDKAKALCWYEKAAEQGERTAQFNCGNMYYRGVGTEKDLDKAAFWLEKSKAQGETEAEKLLQKIQQEKSAKPEPEKTAPASAAADAKPADALMPQEMYEQGMELYRAGDYDRAFPLLDRACLVLGPRRDMFPDGHAAVGWMCEHGKGTNTNLTTAHIHYRHAARNGDRDGMAGMARLTAAKDSPLVSECQAALDYIKKLNTPELTALLPALEKKLAAAQAREARDAQETPHKAEQDAAIMAAVDAYKAGDHKKELELYQKAAQLGSAVAMFNCGTMYYKGEGTKADQAKALYWFEQAAQQEDGSAQFDCGLMYYKGEGTPADPAKALYWFEKAAGQGFKQAQLNCGMMYYEGEGTQPDQAKALHWYKEAAQQGEVKAQLSCGNMYRKGEGTKVDKAKALYWYEQAAQQGDAKAQFNCGVMYDRGEGTARDRDKATAWFRKAADQREAKEAQEKAKKVP
jgi:hypothetical protein